MAARGNVIIISAEPNGKFLDIVVSGTPKPGTCMELMAAFYEGGVHQMRVYQPGTDGQRRPVFVLLEKNLVGGGVDDAYTDGERGRVYCPQAGDELNVRVKDVSGTGTNDEFAVAELAIIDSGSGLLIRTAGTPESQPFMALAVAADVAADTLYPFMFTGY